MNEVLMSGFEAAYFTLPKEVVTTTREAGALREALDGLELGTESVEHLRARFRKDLLAAAAAGKPLPDGTKLIEARVAGEVQTEKLEILREAVRQSERIARREFKSRQTEILVEHLQPAFAETVAIARKARGKDLVDLRTRFRAIKGARTQLSLPEPTEDVFGMFADYRDTDEWWPEFYPERSRARTFTVVAERQASGVAETSGDRRVSQPAEIRLTPPPYPNDPMERFKWDLTKDLWLPTPAQQDARFREYLKKAQADHGERSKQWREQNWQTA